MKVITTLAAAILLAAVAPAAETVWRLDNLERLRAQSVVVVGAPRVVEADVGPALAFNGASDALFLPEIPFAGARHFTIEVLFFPASGGPAEQRFLHAQDRQDARALLETRLDGQGKWWLDTYIVTGATARGVTLIDREQRHPTDRWYWVALRYDGKSMAHFVNGEKELEAPARFVPFGPGQISLGVRQNRIHWFKGMIREVRFHAEALPDEKLRRTP